MNSKFETAGLEPEDTLIRFAEADHRIANHLAMLASYVRLKGVAVARRDAPLDSNGVQSLIRMIVTQIGAISDLHRILSARGNPNTLNVSDSLSRMCDAMTASVASEINIVQAFEKECEIASMSILPVTQICAEIITNALKHGCNTESSDTIRVACKSSAGTVIVEVSDTGPGLSEGSAEARRDCLGTSLIDALIQQVDGRIEYLSTSQGLTVRLTLPAALKAVSTQQASQLEVQT